MDPADLEDLLPAQAEPLVPAPAGLVVVALFVFGAELSLVPALFDVAEQLDAELVGIEPAGLRGHRAGVMVGVINQLGGMRVRVVMIVECQYDAQPSFMILVCPWGAK